jgi:hypothetical protein
MRRQNVIGTEKHHGLLWENKDLAAKMFTPSPSFSYDIFFARETLCDLGHAAKGSQH